MNICFKKNMWDETDIIHAYTYRFPYTNKFVQNEDCIENGVNPGMSDGFDYLSLVTKEKYPLGTKMIVHCSFSGDAAPLLIFADSLDKCEDGSRRYGNYFEVVLYKNGINVWRLWRKKDGSVTWHKRLGAEFPVAEDEIHTLCVKLVEDYIYIDIDGISFSLRTEDIFSSCHMGITGCEGPCRFYDMNIE